MCLESLIFAVTQSSRWQGRTIYNFIKILPSAFLYCADAFPFSSTIVTEIVSCWPLFTIARNTSDN